MASGPRRPGYYLGVLISGFLAGGFLTAIARRFLPDSAAKEVFTFTVAPTLGPVSVDLLVVNFTLGPVGLDVTLLSLVGVVVAFFIARSLF
jgi:hypothetical protein